MSDLLNATLGAVGQVGEAVDKVTGGRALRGALAGKPRELASFVPFSDTMGLTNKADSTTGRDLTDHYNITRKGDDSFASHAIGFGADMVASPLSLLGGASAFKAAPTVAKGLVGAGKAITGLDAVEHAGGAIKGLAGKLSRHVEMPDGSLIHALGTLADDDTIRHAAYPNAGFVPGEGGALKYPVPHKPVDLDALHSETLPANASRPRRWSADPAERAYYSADRGRRYAERMSGRDIPNPKSGPSGVPEFNLSDAFKRFTGDESGTAHFPGGEGPADNLHPDYALFGDMDGQDFSNEMFGGHTLSEAEQSDLTKELFGNVSKLNAHAVTQPKGVGGALSDFIKGESGSAKIGLGRKPAAVVSTASQHGQMAKYVVNQAVTDLSRKFGSSGGILSRPEAEELAASFINKPSFPSTEEGLAGADKFAETLKAGTEAAKDYFSPLYYHINKHLRDLGYAGAPEEIAAIRGGKYQGAGQAAALPHLAPYQHEDLAAFYKEYGLNPAEDFSKADASTKGYINHHLKEYFGPLNNDVFGQHVFAPKAQTHPPHGFATPDSEFGSYDDAYGGLYDPTDPADMAKYQLHHGGHTDNSPYGGDGPYFHPDVPAAHAAGANGTMMQKALLDEFYHFNDYEFGGPEHIAAGYKPPAASPGPADMAKYSQAHGAPFSPDQSLIDAFTAQHGKTPLSFNHSQPYGQYEKAIKGVFGADSSEYLSHFDKGLADHYKKYGFEVDPGDLVTAAPLNQGHPDPIGYSAHVDPVPGYPPYQGGSTEAPLKSYEELMAMPDEDASGLSSAAQINAKLASIKASATTEHDLMQALEAAGQANDGDAYWNLVKQVGDHKAAQASLPTAGGWSPDPDKLKAFEKAYGMKIDSQYMDQPASANPGLINEAYKVFGPENQKYLDHFFPSQTGQFSPNQSLVDAFTAKHGMDPYEHMGENTSKAWKDAMHDHFGGDTYDHIQHYQDMAKADGTGTGLIDAFDSNVPNAHQGFTPDQHLLDTFEGTYGLPPQNYQLYSSPGTLHSTMASHFGDQADAYMAHFDSLNKNHPDYVPLAPPTPKPPPVQHVPLAAYGSSSVDQSQLPAVRNAISGLTGLMEHSRMPKDMNLWRGIDGKGLRAIEQQIGMKLSDPAVVGKEFVDPAFLSTAYDPGDANSFAGLSSGYNRPDQGAVFDFGQVPKGKPASMMNASENEILFPPGRTIKITDNSNYPQLKAKMWGTLLAAVLGGRAMNNNQQGAQ